MAVSTFTSTIYEGQQSGGKAVHVGNQSISGKIVYSGTVGDILFLAKIPHGATIVDMSEFHTSGETALGISFGLSKGVVAGGAGSNSCLISSGALSTMNRLSWATWPVASNFPPTVSLSDLDSVRYANFVAKIESGTATISSSIMWSITYRMDGPYPSGGGAGT